LLRVSLADGLLTGSVEHAGGRGLEGDGLVLDPKSHDPMKGKQSFVIAASPIAPQPQPKRRGWNDD
jgi:hypothetical protein